jgi:hypothetical protein
VEPGGRAMGGAAIISTHPHGADQWEVIRAKAFVGAAEAGGPPGLEPEEEMVEAEQTAEGGAPIDDASRGEAPGESQIRLVQEARPGVEVAAENQRLAVVHGGQEPARLAGSAVLGGEPQAQRIERVVQMRVGNPYMPGGAVGGVSGDRGRQGDAPLALEGSSTAARSASGRSESIALPRSSFDAEGLPLRIEGA